MTRSISILQSRQIERARIDASVNLPKNRSWNMSCGPHIKIYYFLDVLQLIHFSVAGFSGKDCSVDVDLCSLGLCGEHTVICAETESGQDVSCTCGRGVEPVGWRRIHPVATFPVCFMMIEIEQKQLPFSSLWCVGFFFFQHPDVFIHTSARKLTWQLRRRTVWFICQSMFIDCSP